MGRVHKEYYSANATYLSDEAIKEIKESPGKMPDAVNAMAKKYRISHTRVIEYIENRECKQQIRNTNSINWDKEIESIYDLYAELPY